MASDSYTTSNYWETLQLNRQDVEFLHTYLFEHETPLTAHELVAILVNERVRAERISEQARRQAGGKQYAPKESFQVGDSIVFPALNWKHGKVTASRAGQNPEIGVFDVLTIELEDGTQRLFASNLADHVLNHQPASIEEAGFDPATIIAKHTNAIEKKIEAAFQSDEELVKIAGRWFPRALLVDVNVGHLNLAEAVLDMSGGEPLATSALVKEVGLPEGINLKLAEFSLNYALQEDDRFDEVGPAGEVLWCLRRLEPDGVRDIPSFLQYNDITYSRSALTDQMLALESQLDDELTPVDTLGADEIKDASVSLIFPHLRSGTLPLSGRVSRLFPTAYESPRVRFTLVDGKTKQKMPGWVVREHGYVYGLREWYKANELIPGSIVHIKRGTNPGEVIIESQPYKIKDWVRTAIIGADGGIVFAMLKQSITVAFNDRMVFAIPSPEAVDQIWAQDQKRSFDQLVVSMIRELSKLTPQGHVHAQELYSAINIVRRVPPAPLFALLATKPEITHVGDLHFRLSE
jgi:hypothetical protein